jgi:hypothetical protein
MKYASAYPSASILVWLFLVVILVGTVLMHSSAAADTLCAWIQICGANRSADRPPHTSVPEMYQPRNVLFGVVQPGRLGVIEQPGRRGVIDHDSRPGADPGQGTREPTPPGGRLRPIIVEALLNRQVSVPLMLDTGASYTVLTKQTAHDLGITSDRPR